MATLNEITTLIAAQLEMPLDDPFKLMLALRVQYWRSRLLKNSLDKDIRDRQFFKQTIFIKMVEMKEVDCELPYKQCHISISCELLPRPLRANGILFDYCGAVDGSNAFTKLVPGTLRYMLQSKFTARSIRFSYENNRTKVWGNAKLPIMRIDAIWDDPWAAAKFSCCSRGITCDFWNDQYPVSGDVLQLIVQSILQIDYDKKSSDNGEQIPVAQKDPNK
jgi:hypothetical protein